MGISDCQRAQTALQESERRFRALMEAAPDSIVVVDETGHITLVNAQAEALFGWPRAELLGQPVEILLPECFVKQHVQDRSRYWAAPRTRPMGIGLELTGRRKDGSEFPLEINLSPWEAGDGLRVIAAVRDITARKSLEEQLCQSQKMETIERLAGGMAHDFNNLLTAIIGYSQLALSRLNPGERLHSDVEEILKAGERAAALTSQLLAFSRRQVLQPKVLDLNAVIANMHKMLPRLIGEDIELMTVAEPALGRVKADPGQIEQVIIKLAVNARDAMPHGGKLTIETANVDLDESYSRRHLGVVPGHYILLAVSDTGVGMDAETQARIFEPFFTTKEVGKGTGLGLSTVYGIIKQSGGNIWVYSEPNRGTTFKIYLPRVNELAKTTVTPSSMDESLKGSETILLAEDDAAIRGLVRQILEMGGYTVLEAGTVGEALRLGRQRESPIDLLITDVIMPEMGGRELAQRVAALRPGMKVLYMSGYTDNAIIHHGVLDAGISFLQKPFTPDALTRKVREVLAGS